MKIANIKLLFGLMILITTSCSSDKILIQKEKTEFGNVRFYIENNLKNNKSKKKISCENRPHIISIKSTRNFYFRNRDSN